MVLAGVLFGGDSGDKNLSDFQNSSVKKAPVFICDVEGVGKVKGSVASNVGMAIYDIEERSSVGGEFFNKRAQGRFVIVSVAVANEQKDAITVDAASFKLVTKDGVEFSHSTDAQLGLGMENGGEMNSFLKTVNPEMVVSVQVPFDVPERRKLSDLMLEVRGGFTGAKMRLPLSVQKEE